MIAIILALVLAAASDPQSDPQPPSLTPEQAQALIEQLDLPPGSKIKLTFTDRDLGSTTTTDSGTGVGAGATAEGQTLDESFTGSAPVLAIGDASGTGGGAEREAEATGWSPPASPWRNPMLWMGVLLMLVSGVCVYFGLRRAGTYAGIAGVALVAGAIWPIMFLWLALGAIAVVAVPFVISEYQVRKAESEASRQRSALRAVVGGVAGLKGTEAYTAAKESIARAADKADEETIAETKRTNQIGGKR